MSHHVKCIFKIYEDMAYISLMLEMFIALDVQTEIRNRNLFMMILMIMSLARSIKLMIK